MGHNQLCEPPEQQPGNRRTRFREEGCNSPWINPPCCLCEFFFPWLNASEERQEARDAGPFVLTV